MDRFDRYVGLTGRLCVAAVFVLAAIAKIAGFGATTRDMQSYGLPSTTFFAVVAIIVEAVGGGLLVVGYRVRPTAAALAAYVVLVTLVMHHDVGIPMNAVIASASVGLIGGLLLLAQRGADAPSLDTYRARRTESAREKAPVGLSRPRAA